MANVTVYGSKTCAACGTVKAFLDKQAVEYDYVDVENDPGDHGHISTLPTTAIKTNDDDVIFVLGAELKAIKRALKEIKE